MTAIEQNINIKPISITALLATFCLATPVKADTLLSTKPPNLILSENQTVAGANQSVNLQPATSNISLTNDNKPLFPLLTKDLTADKNPKIAQIPTSLPSSRPQIPPQNITPPPPTEPPTVPTPPGRETPSPLPPPGELLPPSTSPEVPPTQIQGPIRIKEFKFIGNTAFSSEELAELLKSYTDHPLSFAELFEARSLITKKYVDSGYVTSGALIPPQKLDGGVLTIQIVEGSLEDIRIDGVQRLNPDYVRSRMAIATQPPLNVPQLLEALRLLQLDPLIANVSAELSAGSSPGTSLLNVQVTEAKTTSVQTFANNDRSPSVGEFRRGFTFRENNLLGLGDGLGFTYNNTDGSGGFDVNYTIPINPQNGTISFGYSNTPSRVLETPFDILNIRAFSRNYEITLRQPIAQSPSEEFALGITASRRESNTTLLEIPFPLSAGADDNGSTRVSALRFFQEYTQRGASEVISFRSQFSVGLGIFDATINATSPDSRFFSWRGQGQWVRLLAPETVLLVRGDVQVADRSLLAIEQYGIGGQNTLRGYRQDILLADNGALLSAEVRVPVIRWPEINTIINLVPFVDVGTAWNTSGASPNPNTLASVGLGLQMAVSEQLNIRLDYGIPLVNTSASRKTLQENGLYFSINFNPF